jgi:hypothetical protein
VVYFCSGRTQTGSPPGGHTPPGPRSHNANANAATDAGGAKREGGLLSQLPCACELRPEGQEQQQGPGGNYNPPGGNNNPQQEQGAAGVKKSRLE